MDVLDRWMEERTDEERFEIYANARHYGVPVEVLAYMLQHETSGFNQAEVSIKGAVGVSQLERNGAVIDFVSTFGGIGDWRGDWRINLKVGAWYLKQCYRWTGDWKKALMAYNWGIGNVRKWQRGEATPPAETVNYVKNVGD